MRKASIVIAAMLLVCLAPTNAQVSATLRAATNLPAGQVPAPNTPGGGVVVGSNVYVTDAGTGGFRHYNPADPASPDPVNTGLLVYDNTTDGMSIGGGTAICFGFCKASQVAYDGNQTVYVAANDQPKGQPFTADHPGVHRLTIDPLTGVISSDTLLVPNAGLAGNLADAVALGPDGNVYVGFEKNGNVVRIVNPFVDPANDPNKTQIVQSVGVSPNGRPIRGLIFVGPDLYVASSDSLSLIKNAVAASCLGGCNAVATQDGFLGKDHVGITSDGLNRLYLAINGLGVYRFTIAPQATQLVSLGGADPRAGMPQTFAFVGGHSNLLQLDRLGNLWVGDDTSDGNFNFSGRIWYISAGALSNIP